MTLVILAGTALAYFGIMRPFYGVPARGSLALFFALTALYAFTSAGLGLVAATFTRRTGQVGMLALLIVMPVVMLSGIRTPWESQQTWLRMVMALSPLHHVIEIAYGILLRGAGLAVIWDSVLAMADWAVSRSWRECCGSDVSSGSGAGLPGRHRAWTHPSSARVTRRPSSDDRWAASTVRRARSPASTSTGGRSRRATASR
jgi:hypothetical protein